MVKNIKEIAKGLGAKMVGQVEDGSGVFGAMRAARNAQALSVKAGLGPISAMREAPEELDQIVEDAMRDRRLQAWRPGREDFAVLESMAEKSGRSLSELLDEAVRLLRQHWDRKQIQEQE